MTNLTAGLAPAAWLATDDITLVLSCWRILVLLMDIYRYLSNEELQNETQILVTYRLQIARGGGYFHQNRMWMCLPDLENLTFSIPIFCLTSHPSVYHFRKKSIQF